jgi:hypothetical protein
MVKKLVIHALFVYTNKQKQRSTAYRGDTIDVTGQDLERGTKFGAFGTQADLVPKGLDEGVVDLAAADPTGTPVVPAVSRSAIVETVLRERLGLEPGATESQVVAALDAAMAKAKEEPKPAEPPAPPSSPTLAEPPAPVEPVIVNLPPVPDDDAATADQDDSGAAEVEDEGQADAVEQTPTVEPPPQSAVKARWEAHAVLMGMTEGEAKAASKQDLIAKYGG